MQIKLTKKRQQKNLSKAPYSPNYLELTAFPVLKLPEPVTFAAAFSERDKEQSLESNPLQVDTHRALKSCRRHPNLQWTTHTPVPAAQSCLPNCFLEKGEKKAFDFFFLLKCKYDISVPSNLPDRRIIISMELSLKCKNYLYCLHRHYTAASEGHCSTK